MTLKKTFLDTSETLARIREALPPGHKLLGLARDFASGAEEPGYERGLARVAGGFQTGLQAAVATTTAAARAAEAWPGEFGALFPKKMTEGSSGVVAILFLGGPPETQGSNPWAAPQLVIDLPPSRYRIEYWKAGDGLLAGVEIGTGPRLVISPPDGTPLVVSVGALP
jgi:hypothetical protein